MITVRVTFWAVILLIILSSLLDVSGDFDLKLTKIEDGNSTIENAILEINSEIHKSHKTAFSNGNNEVPSSVLNKNEKTQSGTAEIHSSFGETFSSQADFKSEIVHRKGTDTAQSVSQVDVSNRVSEAGHAVVVTLVDAAARELQQRAAPGAPRPGALNASAPAAAPLPALRDRGTGPATGPALAAAAAVEQEEQPPPDSAARPPPVPAAPNGSAAAPHDQAEQYVVRAEPKVVEGRDEGAAAEGLAAEAAEANATAAEAGPANASAPAAVAAAPDEGQPEDIPSFSEWAQRQLAEAEEKKKVLNASAGGGGGGEEGGGGGSGGGGGGGGKALKLRSKNYASPDCGAKIVAANAEAVSPGAVLSASSDEYMLNTCNARAWFVVELCEAIQIKKVELANFELYSSSPRDFVVSVGEGVQGREWRAVGRFSAADDRAVQAFALAPQPFGRHVKVEVLSHHGQEHFCPLSLFRVYGTSEFEVLQKVDEAADEEEGAAGGAGRLALLDGDEDDEDGDGDGAGGAGGAGDGDGAAAAAPGDPPRNLFESYKNAVLSIVKKAAQALTKSGDDERGGGAGGNETAANATAAAAGEAPPGPGPPAAPAPSSAPAAAPLCKSPRHLVVCDNCSDALFADVFALLSCRGRALEALLAAPLVADAVREGGRCAALGLPFASRRPGAPFPLPPAAAAAAPRPADYLAALLPPSHLAALCNLLAVAERRVALNASSEAWNATARAAHQPASPSPPPSLTPAPAPPSSPPAQLPLGAPPPATCPSASPPPPSEGLAAQIRPTRTLARREGGEDTAAPAPSGPSAAPPPPPPVDASAAPTVRATHAPPPPADAAPDAPAPASAADLEGEGAAPGEDAEAADGDGPAFPEDAAAQDNLDTLLRDLNDLEQGEAGATAPAPSSSSPAPAPASTPAPSAPRPPPQAPAVQKESVFVRLANRIKALERNMSLSGQYLEELSRRYKKQVEEMQKAFNRTLQAVHEASRMGEEREARQQEEMQQMQLQLSRLSESLQNLVDERGSWLNRLNVIAQHLILICIEILVFVLLMYFCRRLPESGGTNCEERKTSVGTKGRRGNRATVNRRKSVEGVSGHESPRTRYRRPSEEALHIAGSYQDLLISEPGVSEVDAFIHVPKGDTRRRRRKKKDLLLRSASIRLPVKTSESLMNVAEEQKSVSNRRASSLELGVRWASSNGVSVDEEEEGVVHKDSKVLLQLTQSPLDPLPSCHNTSTVIETVSPHIGCTDANPLHQKDTSQRQIRTSNTNTLESQTKQRSASDTVAPLTRNNGLIRSSVTGNTVQRQLSPPVFMRTATSIRNSRLGSSSVEPSPPAKLKSDNWEWYSAHHGLDKSSQSNKVTCPVSCPGSGTGDPNQQQNGHSAPEEARRSSNASSNASSSASSTSNISEGISRKNTGKKGPSSLKKMVKKFF